MCVREDHCSTPVERNNQERMSEYHLSSSFMLEASSTRCVDSRIRQLYFLSWILDRTCVKLCSAVQKQIHCTSLSPCRRQLIDRYSSQCHDTMIQPFCCTSGSHQRLLKCSVSVKGMILLRLFLMVESCASRPIACLRLCDSCSCPGWPVLPKFLHVLTSVSLVLLVLLCVRVPFWLWCFSLPFPLPFLRVSTCTLLASSAPVLFPADTVGEVPKFWEE